jgi:hypothetical protein
VVVAAASNPDQAKSWKDIFDTLPNTSFEIVDLRSVRDRVLSTFRVVGHGTASVPAFTQMA